MAITDWPLAERPREKLIHQGASSLSDAELLAIFLRTGLKGKTAVDVARDLLAEFGSLRSLLEADQRSFCNAAGLGLAKFAQLQAVTEMARRHLFEGLRAGAQLSSPSMTVNYLKAQLRGELREVFACLFLDNQHRVLAFERLFEGTLSSAMVHPREVVRRCLFHNAAAVILSHNHPSGVAEPSRADRDITRQLVDALALIDVRVLDHIVVGDPDTVSFAECGWLP